MLRRIPQVNDQRIVLAVPSVLQELFGHVQVALAIDILEGINVGPHSHGDHAVQRSMRSHEDPFGDRLPVKRGGDSLAHGGVVERRGGDVEAQVSDISARPFDHIEVRVLLKLRIVGRR